MYPHPPHLGPFPDALPEPTGADGERWLSLGRYDPWLPWALDLIWLGLIIVLAAQTWDRPGCSQANPCERAAWAEATFFSLLGVVFWWFHRHPHLALPGVAALTGLELIVDPDLPGYPGWVLPVFLAGAFASGVLVVWQLGRRREQRDLFRGVAVTVPGIDVRLPWWPPSLRLIGAAACVCAAAILTGWAAWHQQSDAAHAARATATSGTVLEHTEDGALRVAIEEAAVALDTDDATGYPVGSEVTVLIDGAWTRLRAEPYDPSIAGAGVILLGLIAATRMLEELRIRRAAAQWRRPHRALRLRARWIDIDRVVLDPGRPTPLVTLAVLPVASTLPEGDLADENTDETEGWDEDDEWSAPTVDSLREASRELAETESVAMHGELAFGAIPCLVFVTDEGQDLVAVAGDGPVRAALRLRDDPAEAARHLVTSVESGAGELGAASVTPQVFGGGLAPRAAGTLLLVAVPVAAVALAYDAELPWLEVAMLAGLGLTLGTTGLTMIMGRMMVGSNGIALRSAARSRVVPWDDIDHCEPGGPPVLVTRDDQFELSGGLPKPVRWFQRAALGRRGDVDVVDAINAMVVNPSARPLAPTTPLGDVPLAVRLGLAVAYLVLLGLCRALA